MFPRVGRFASQVLDLTSRAVGALEGIVGALSVQNLVFERYFDEQASGSPLVAGLDHLTHELNQLVVAHRELGPAVERVEALELSRVRWEAECEGMLLKADGKHNAAKAAEMRERQLKRSYETRDPFENGDGGEPTQEERARLLDERGVAKAFQEPVVVAPPSRKARAVLAKWRM